MKCFVQLSLLTLCATLSGCAAIAPSSTASTPVIDLERMAVIERAALRNGVQVHWVTPPQKLRPASGG
jgi:hypothetical protein